MSKRVLTIGASQATISAMPNKRDRKPGRPKTRKETVQVSVRLDADLVKMLNDHVDTLRPESSVRAVLQLAVEEYLERAGLWPPPPGE